MEWYYAEAATRTGPLQEEEMRALVAAGSIRRDTLVWRAGMAGWEPLANVPDFPTRAPVAGAICAECERDFPANALLTFEGVQICASCKPVFFQRLRELGAAAAIKHGKRYGGFWIRVLARVIDSAILGAAFVALVFLWEAAMRGVLFSAATPTASQLAMLWGGLGIIYLLSTAAFVIYEAWFLVHRGATPGKLVVGVHVVRADGSSLTRGRSIGRSFGYLLTNMLPLGIGFIMVGVDEEKRALHDRICDTRVVYR